MNAIDREDLVDFVARVDRIAQSPIYGLDRVSSFELERTANGRARATTTEPDDITVSGFVNLLRPIAMLDERTSFRRVFDLCERRLNDVALRDRVREIRREWSKAQRAGAIKIVVNGEPWRPDRVTHLIINAYYAHDEREKRRQLEALGAVGMMLTRQVFFQHILRAGAAAKELAKVVRFGLRDGRFN